LLANQWGVCLALLNWYEQDAAVPSSPQETVCSRGHVVSGLADADSLASVERRLESEIDLTLLRPFLLAGFEPAGDATAPILWQWDGREKLTLIEEPEMPVFSSGYDIPGVIEARRKAYGRIVGGGPAGETALAAFHHDGGERENSAYSVRMNRPDAQTWSISRIRVSPDRVQFRYEAERLSLVGEPAITQSEMAILSDTK